MNPFSIEHTRFIRDSRHAFGHRFQVEKPNRDWLWAVAAFATACLAIVAMAVQL